MAITLLNRTVAVKDIVPHDHYSSGTVGTKDSQVTICNAGDTVYFRKDAGMIVVFNGVEYILLSDTELLAKGT